MSDSLNQTAKVDAGKPRVSLVPTEVIRCIAKIKNCYRGGNVTVAELRQYRSLKCEIKELKEKIEGCRSHDVVRASDKEFPYVSHSVKLHGLNFTDEQVSMYLAERNRIYRQMIHIEAWVNSISDSELRRIFRYRYIDGDKICSWKHIAFKLGVSGDGTTERRKHNKYLNKIEKNV